MEEFIREQIKEKPLNKKKIVVRLAVSALCGLVFALVACIVMAFVLPFFSKDKGTSEAKETESQILPTLVPSTEVSTEDVSKNDKKPEVKEITIEDYQKIMSQLYAIGSNANNSIVAVNKVVGDNGWFKNSYESVGSGTGIVIAENDKEYVILTEHKAIENAKAVSVNFINDQSAEAKVKKYDANTGITILTVAKKNVASSVRNTVRVAELAKPCGVTKGMTTIALGSPLGTNYSILTGTVTSTINEVSKWDNNYTVFTTDIVSSDDGSGVLINVEGKIVGLVIPEFNSSGSNPTLTAVSISDVEPVLELLMKGKDIPYLGLQIVTVTSNIANTYNLPNGVYIKAVNEGSPAMMAGIQVGDVITEINGTAISSVSDYNALILGLSPEETYKIKYMRESKDGYTERSCQVEAGVLQ